MRRNSHLTAIAGFVLSAILLAAGGLLLWGSTYTHNMVHNQLAAQQIYFPPKAAFVHPKPKFPLRTTGSASWWFRAGRHHQCKDVLLDGRAGQVVRAGEQG